MIEAKEQIQAALEEALAELAPGVALNAVLESPRQASHGDLAITAAMGLAL